MFDIIPKFLSSIFTFLFPLFASYKALKTSDPALLTPWLMYWVVLACCLLVESWTDWFLVWIPFYAWIRAGFLLYLILPQTQGARLIYQQYVDPFLQENEMAIDDFISSAHERAKNAGLSYMKRVIELIKEHVLGLPPKQPSPPPTPSGWSYTQSLMARFNMPATRPSFPGSAVGTGIDFNSLLASAIAATTARGSSPNTAARELSDSGMLIPPNLQGNEDKMSFITAQRERLSVLMAALDTEARNIVSGSPRPTSMSFDGGEASTSKDVDESTNARRLSGLSGLSKSRSEADFEKIERDEESESPQRPAQDRSSSGSWLPWAWHAGQKLAEDAKDTDMGGMDRGKSSGVDT